MARTSPLPSASKAAIEASARSPPDTTADVSPRSPCPERAAHSGRPREQYQKEGDGEQRTSSRLLDRARVKGTHDKMGQPTVPAARQKTSAMRFTRSAAANMSSLSAARASNARRLRGWTTIETPCCQNSNPSASTDRSRTAYCATAAAHAERIPPRKVQRKSIATAGAIPVEGSMAKKCITMKSKTRPARRRERETSTGRPRRRRADQRHRVRTAHR